MLETSTTRYMILKRHFTNTDKTNFAFTDVGRPSIKSDEVNTLGHASTESIITEDEMLLGMLQRNSSGTMRQIVQSIQAEQDEVIRVDGDVVVVQGPAGSGKTVVALHRAAYLLYHMREKRQLTAQRFGHISAQRMLVFSPNNIFASYISSVLPDLNEDQVTQMILENVIREEIQRQFPQIGRGSRTQIESREDHFEYVLSQNGDPFYQARIIGSAFKSSAAMLTSIETFVHDLDRQVEAAFEDMELSIYGQVITDASQRIFYHKSEMQDLYRLSRISTSLVESIENVLQSIVKRIAEFEKTSWISARDGEGRNPLAITVRRLQQEKQKIESLMRPYTSHTLTALYTSLLLQNTVSLSGEITDVLVESTKYTTQSEQGSKIPYEDIVPMLLLNGYYRGFPRWRDIDHAVVDEAQDYSLLHYEYIKHCLPDDCSLTIVGDVNQAINPSLNLRDYSLLETVFPKRIRRMELKRSYRSSVEITDFASQILKDSLHIDNVRRTGSKPKLLSTQEGGQAQIIATLIDTLTVQNYKSIAVLCRTRRDSEALFQQLRSITQVKLLSDGVEAVQGTLVLQMHLAKGLEFDAVILHDAGQMYYNREEERTLLYTACTRALHNLYICYSGQPSPLLPIAKRELYDNVGTAVNPDGSMRILD